MRWGRAHALAAGVTGIKGRASLRATPSKSLAFKLALLAVAPLVLLSTVLLLGVTYQFERLSEMTIGKSFKPTVYEKPLDLPTLAAHLRRIAAGSDMTAELLA